MTARGHTRYDWKRRASPSNAESYIQHNVWVVFWLLFLLPLLGCALFPGRRRHVVLLGAALVAIQWPLAYRGSLVAHGGDSTGGAELVLATGVVSLTLLGAWILLAFAGSELGRLARRHSRFDARRGMSATRSRP